MCRIKRELYKAGSRKQEAGSRKQEARCKMKIVEWERHCERRI
jgi:hypothetical protein